jgi:hypothetical protein
VNRGGGREAVVVVAVWAALGAKYLLDNFLVSHDAIQTLEIFHYFYSHLTTAGDPPRWLAYGLHSRPAGINQIGGLSAAQYPVALVGWLLGVRNANTLFVVSALLEQLVLAVGLIVLGRRLYASPLARIYVGVAGVATAFFWTQTAWNQRLYYLWPLLIVFLVRFFDTRRAAALWTSLLLLVLSFPGVPPYIAALQIVIFLLFGTAMLVWTPHWRRAPDWASLPSRASLALFGALLLSSVCFLVIASEGLSFTVVASPGRIPGTSAVTIGTYLAYAQPSVQQYLEFLFAVPYERDLNVTTYVGLVTLTLVFYGLFRQAAPLCRAFWTVAIVLIALSLSNLTFVAPLLYHFPPMALFRHLAFVVVFVKLFAIVLAGYGLDAYVNDRTAALRRLRQPAPGLPAVGGALVGLVVALDVWVFRGEAPYVRQWANLSAIPFSAFHYVAIAIVAGLLLYLTIAGRRHRPARRGAVVLAAAAFELVSYQTCLFYSLPVRNHPALAEAWTTRPPVFPVTRLPHRAGHPHAPIADALLGRFGTKFVDLDGFLGLDSCAFDVRRDFVNAGVERLIRARRGLPLDVPLPPPAPVPDAADAVLWRALGCGGPTLALSRDVRIVASVDDAAGLIRTRQDIDDSPILLAGLSPAPSAGAEPEAAAPIRIAAHSANETVLDVHSAGGSWLVVKQPFHPSWRATINGTEREIWQANLAFMAVPLERGANRVRLFYDDAATAVATGWLAVVTVAGTIAVPFVLFGWWSAPEPRRKPFSSPVGLR